MSAPARHVCPHCGEPLPQYIRAAHDRIAELEALLGTRGQELPPAIGLTRKQVELLGYLMLRNFAADAGAYAALYGGMPECDQPDIKILQVQVCKMRAKLAPFGIKIDRRLGQGYYLTAENKAKVRALMAGAA
jgi:DNA-binding response OmpR family regulator